MVRDALWTLAVNDPATVEAMLNEDSLMTLYAAIDQHASVTMAMLDHAKTKVMWERLPTRNTGRA